MSSRIRVYPIHCLLVLQTLVARIHKTPSPPPIPFAFSTYIGRASRFRRSAAEKALYICVLSPGRTPPVRLTFGITFPPSVTDYGVVMEQSRRSKRSPKPTPKANDRSNSHGIRKSRKIKPKRKNEGAATKESRTEANASKSKPASAILALDIGTATCTAQWVVQIGEFHSKPVQLSFETAHGGQKDATEIPTEIAVYADQNKQLRWKLVHETVIFKHRAITGNLKRAFADREQSSIGERDDSAARDCDATAMNNGQRTYIPRSNDCHEACTYFTSIGVDENTLKKEITPQNALEKFLSCLVQLFKDQILNAPLADHEYRQKTTGLTIDKFDMTLRVAVPSHYQGTTTSRFVELAQSAGIGRVEVDLEIAAVCTSLSKELDQSTEFPATGAADSYIVIDGGGGNIVRPRTGNMSSH